MADSGIAIATAPLAGKSTHRLTQQQLAGLVNDGASEPVVASAIYELANLYFRQSWISEHPLQDRTEPLVELLGSLVSRMALIEEGQIPGDVPDPDEISRTVKNSVALIIALTDTLSLLKVEAAVGKYHQAMQLRHRRIQVEAAAALARFDEAEGKQKLLDLAAHPVVRPRVIAYAKELGFESEISLEHTGPIATAETELALWLAQPQQMGLAPTEMNLIDQRQLYWPSYEEPLDCYLFSFEYGTGENAYRNVGISGPLTHAFVADITTLSAADQYSAFAGWQTMSDEIFMVPIERATQALAGPTQQLKRQLEQQLFAEFEIQYVASFFGEYVMVVSGTKADSQQSGTLIVELDEQFWIPAGNEASPIDCQLAFEIWSGRKLLTNFNPAFS